MTGFGDEFRKNYRSSFSNPEAAFRGGNHPETQTALFAALHSCMVRYPDMRLGQIIMNAVGDDPFYVEDRTMVAKLLEFAAK